MKSVVIIVGAGRSGTTLLKDLLGNHNEFGKTEFEQNHLWRYGNSNLPHDFLNEESHFQEKTAAYIRARLSKEIEKNKGKKLVEKTVANVARVGFVAKILPSSKIIHIIRDGRAVTASAIHRWQAKPESGYLIKKILTVPCKDIPRASFDYLKSFGKAIVRKRSYRQSWGPRWPGTDEDVKTLSLTKICARQWRMCVESAIEQGRALHSDKYLEIRYEDLVAHRLETTLKILDFLELDLNDQRFLESVKKKISDNSLDKWKTELNSDQVEEIEAEAGALLRKIEYI